MEERKEAMFLNQLISESLKKRWWCKESDETPRAKHLSVFTRETSCSNSSWHMGQRAENQRVWSALSSMGQTYHSSPSKVQKTLWKMGQEDCKPQGPKMPQRKRCFLDNYTYELSNCCNVNRTWTSSSRQNPCMWGRWRWLSKRSWGAIGVW